MEEQDTVSELKSLELGKDGGLVPGVPLHDRDQRMATAAGRKNRVGGKGSGQVLPWLVGTGKEDVRTANTEPLERAKVRIGSEVDGIGDDDKLGKRLPAVLPDLRGRLLRDGDD